MAVPYDTAVYEYLAQLANTSNPAELVDDELQQRAQTLGLLTEGGPGGPIQLSDAGRDYLSAHRQRYQDWKTQATSVSNSPAGPTEAVDTDRLMEREG